MKLIPQTNFSQRFCCPRTPFRHAPMERATDDRFKGLGWQFGAAEPEASLLRRSGRNERNGTPVSGVPERRQRASRLTAVLRYRRKGRKHVERSRCPAAV